MSHDPCPNCGDTESGRYKKQVATFYEDADGGTEVIDWEETLSERCGNCEEVISDNAP